ncbi:MAG: HAD family hydrolase [Candidatus Aenigmarchaeota archaeon]
MAIEAVIFDFDGVISDSKETIFKIYEAVCKEMGIEFYDSISDFTKNLDGNYKHFYIKLGIKEKDFSKANKIYKKHFLQLGEGIGIFEGMEEVLVALKSKGFKIGISSNTHEFIVRALLQRFGIEEHVDLVVGGKDINKLKPDPALINLVMEKMGVDPEHTAYIGDMEVDMLAGRAANVGKLIAVTYGFHSKEMLERFDPDAMAYTPEEILDNV